MGIRNEIERLRDCHLRAISRIEQICTRCDYQDDYGCILALSGNARGVNLQHYHRVCIGVFEQILSILDEWELVAEHFAQKTGVIIYATDDDEYALLEGCDPGDHIAIYVRREEEGTCR